MPPQYVANEVADMLADAVAEQVQASKGVIDHYQQEKEWAVMVSPRNTDINAEVYEEHDRKVMKENRRTGKGGNRRIRARTKRGHWQSRTPIFVAIGSTPANKQAKYGSYDADWWVGVPGGGGGA